MTVIQVSGAPSTEAVKGHQTEAARARIVGAWAGNAAIDLTSIPAGSAIGRLIAEFPSETKTGWSRPDPKIRTLKEVEFAFEQLIAADERRRNGAVYTPAYIVDYLLRESDAMRLKSGSAPAICDPACGSGGFLVRAASQLSTQYGLSAREIFARHIVGFDLDAGAIGNSRILCECFALERSESIAGLDVRLFTIDSLLTPVSVLHELSDSARGFDVVATNPPYVKLQNLSESYRRSLEGAFPELANGSFSLALLFLLRCHALLGENGVAALITQNNLFTSLAGVRVRDRLKKLRAIRRIVDFGHQSVFGTVSAYTCLVFLSEKPVERFEFARVETEPLEHSLGSGIAFSPIETRSLKSKKWRLAGEPHRTNLYRIENIGRSLRDLADIRVGFATLKDSVFLVEADGTDCVAGGAKGIPECRIEMEATRPATKISRLRKEGDLEDVMLRVIFPYKEMPNGRTLIIEEGAFRAEFPAAYEYLRSVRPLLEGRDKGKAQYPAWYAWGRTQGMSAPGPKLLTKTFDRAPNFMLDHSDRLFCNGYAVSPKQGDLFGPMIRIGFLQRVLNSSVMFYYARLTTFQLRGGFQCYQKNFIQHFGIPSVSFDEQAEIERLSIRQAEEAIQGMYGMRATTIEEVLGREALTRTSRGRS